VAAILANLLRIIEAYRERETRTICPGAAIVKARELGLFE
jgi:hypothetical protein